MDENGKNNKNKKMKLEDKKKEGEDKLNNLCIQNIHDFFNF